MPFLKKLAQVLATVGATAIGIGPLVAPLFGSASGKVANGIAVVTNDLTAVGTVIVQIEAALAGKTGADKLAAAITLVTPIIMTSQLISGKKIADAALLQKGIAEITQGVVDTLNSIHEDAVKSEIHT